MNKNIKNNIQSKDSPNYINTDYFFLSFFYSRWSQEYKTFFFDYNVICQLKSCISLCFFFIMDSSTEEGRENILFYDIQLRKVVIFWTMNSNFYQIQYIEYRFEHIIMWTMIRIINQYWYCNIINRFLLGNIMVCLINSNSIFLPWIDLAKVRKQIIRKVHLKHVVR